MEQIKLLGIIGSPRSNSNSKIMLDEAIKGFESVLKPDLTIIDISNKKIDHCIACNRCKENKECVLNDDFNNIFQIWIKADALLYSAPVYHASVPSKLKALIDRIGHVSFASYNRNLPRLCKVGGALVQGTSRYGGQELTIQFLINHLLIMNCIPVSGDTPGSYLGAPGESPRWEKGSIIEDKIALKTARNLGQRVAEVALIVKAGMNQVREILPKEYFINL